MNLLDLPAAVQKLATLGESWERPAQWKDYRALGIGPEHILALIEVVNHAESFWVDDTDPESWLPIHAWRALGQLQAGQAVPTLVHILPWIDEKDNDLIQEDLPQVFGMVGPAAVQALVAFLEDKSQPQWARVAAAEGLKNIGLLYPETRGVVVEALLQALSRFAENPYPFNSFLILYLSYLKTAEGTPLVEQALRSGRVDQEITGDWEDYQVAVGLLEQRLSPRGPAHSLAAAFTDGLPSVPRTGALTQAPEAAPLERPTTQDKKDKTAHAPLKHAAKQDKAPSKHKRKDAKPKRKKSGKKK